MVNSVDVEPSTVISTQPQTKYRLWNMLVLQLHLKQEISLKVFIFNKLKN